MTMKLPEQFRDLGDALLWLEDLLNDDERMVRIEMSADRWQGKRMYQIRAYPLDASEAWDEARGENLLEMFAWLRHGMRARVGSKT